MRVLHVISSIAREHGGPSVALVQIETALAKQGVKVVTATTDDDGSARHNGKPLGVALSENGVTRWYFRKQLDFYKISLGLAVWTLRNAKHYDVINIHALFSFNALIAAWAARLAGVPYVIRPLGTLNRYGLSQRRRWIKWVSLKLFEGPALGHAAAVHFTSEEEARQAYETAVRMRSVVIPLGIDATGASVSKKRSELQMNASDENYLLFVGRLSPVKNVEGLLRAFQKVADEWPTLRLVIAGDGIEEYVRALKVLAHQLNLDTKVDWPGHVEGEAKAHLLEGAVAFVLPSYSENFGIAAAEALAAGLPCVLGVGVGIAVDAVEANAGVAVSPEPDSIADGMRIVLGDRARRVAMSAAASRLAMERYSTAVMGEKLVALYAEICEK